MALRINFKDFKARNPFGFKARTTEANNLISGLEAKVEIVPDFEVEEGTELNSAFFNQLETDINKEFKERDKQITDLSGQLNGIKIFTDFAQIKAEFTQDTPLLEIVELMPNYSKLIAHVSGGGSQYPYGWGLLEVTKVAWQREEVRYTPAYTTDVNDIYVCRTYQNNGVNALSGWENIKENKVVGGNKTALANNETRYTFNGIFKQNVVYSMEVGSSPSTGAIYFNVNGEDYKLMKATGNTFDKLTIATMNDFFANMVVQVIFKMYESNKVALIINSNRVVSVLQNQGNTLDLNTITEPCEFYAQGCLNAPSGIHGYFKHEFHMNTANYAKQTYSVYNTGDNYTRTKVNGTWGAWKLTNDGQFMSATTPVLTRSMTANVGGRNGSLIDLRAGDANGTGVGIGAGGLTVVGGGESAQAYFSNMPDGGNMATENAVVVSDASVIIRSNAQGGFTDANKYEFKNGDLFIGGVGIKSSLAKGTVKSVQRGSFTEKIQTNYSRPNKTINFSAIDTSKTMAILNASGGSNDGSSSTIALVSISSTNMVVRLGCSVGESIFSWELVEFY